MPFDVKGGFKVGGAFDFPSSVTVDGTAVLTEDLVSGWSGIAPVAVYPPPSGPPFNCATTPPASATIQLVLNANALSSGPTSEGSKKLMSLTMLIQKVSAHAMCTPMKGSNTGSGMLIGATGLVGVLATMVAGDGAKSLGFLNGAGFTE